MCVEQQKNRATDAYAHGVSMTTTPRLYHRSINAFATAIAEERHHRHIRSSLLTFLALILLGGGNATAAFGVEQPGTVTTDRDPISTYVADVLAHGQTGLRNHWRMGDDAKSFSDSVGGNAAIGQGGITYRSLALLPGDPAKAPLLDGISACARLSDGSSFDFEATDSWTVEALIRPARAGVHGTFQALIGKQLSGGDYTGWCVGLYNVNGSLRVAFLATSSQAKQIFVHGDAAVSIDADHHISVHYNGGRSANQVRIEVNGVSNNSVIVADSLGGESIRGSATAMIGSRDGADFYCGHMQELSLYKQHQPTGFAPQPYHHHGLFSGKKPLEPVSSTPTIILDSDLGEDVDDVADLVILAQLAAKGEAKIAAVINASSIPSGIAAQRILATYYGAKVGIYGAYKGNDLSTSAVYAPPIVARFGATHGSGANDNRDNYLDATLAYRAALNGSPDHSVTIICTGPLTVLDDFLTSDANCGNRPIRDDIPKTGLQLATRKVKRIIIVAALFPSSSQFRGPYGWTSHAVMYHNGNADYNMSAHGSAPRSANVVNTLRGTGIETVFVGDEAAATVFTGPAKDLDPMTNPTRYAYDLFAASSPGDVDPQGQRPAWGQLGILFGVRGFGSVGQSSPGTYIETYMLRGDMTVDGGSGSNSQIGPGPGVFSNIAMVPTASQSLRSLLNTMLSSSPGKQR